MPKYPRSAGSEDRVPISPESGPERMAAEKRTAHDDPEALIAARSDEDADERFGQR